MIADVKFAQSVLGVPQGGDAESIYVGSDPEKATNAFKGIASVGSSSKYSTLVWYGNGRLIKSCKLKFQKPSSKKDKMSSEDK